MNAGLQDERAIIRLYRVWKTVHQLVADRGYEMSKDELEKSIDSWRKQYVHDGILHKQNLSFYASAPADSPLDKIYVQFMQEPTVGIKEQRNFIQNMTERPERSFKVGIMVYEKSMSSAATKIIAAVATKLQIDTFQEADLVVNITHHELVPRHIIMTKEEKQELLERYKLKETQLPRIQMADPVARYYGLRRGQVVKIIRRSETSGRYASYRICAG